MKVTEFVGLQMFELSYLGILAVLPFFVAQKYIGGFILSVLLLIGSYHVIRKYTYKAIGNNHGRSVLITGCDTGFGHAFARRLDNLGFTVFACVLNLDGEGAKTLQQSTSDKLHVIKVDVTKDQDVKGALDYVGKTIKQNDIGLWAVVNNAGVNMTADVDFCTMEMYKRVAEINLFGTVRVAKAFLPLLRLTKGRVVNVSSVRGRCAFPVASAYSMAKYGVEAFSDTLRAEMLKFGVKVIVVEPSNYGGATGMLNDVWCQQMEKDITSMWNEASNEVRNTYGQNYLHSLYEAGKSTAKTTYPTLIPVLDAMEDAIVNCSPRYRYLISGGNTLYDIYVVLARLNGILPESWMDFIMARTLLSGLPPIQGVDTEANKS
ncbi:hypothetical protein FSP39_013275 [Pinctada imbricata]|uniref:Uncharacterized protein n=1 Tax=Pinctada imbricata TaxID=66713 RepID=A0AA88XS27_PINIB|nr:hypothetical protein FSP39_013275 [Pinctada imbricata]